MTFLACATAKRPATMAPINPIQNRLSINTSTPYHTVVFVFNILTYAYVFSSNKYVAFYATKIIFTHLPKNQAFFWQPPANLYYSFIVLRRPIPVGCRLLPIFSQTFHFFKNKKISCSTSCETATKINEKEKTHAFAWFLFQNNIPFLPFAAAPFIAGENQIIQISGNWEAVFYHKSTSFPIVLKKYSMSISLVQEAFNDFHKFFSKVCQIRYLLHLLSPRRKPFPQTSAKQDKSS